MLTNAYGEILPQSYVAITMKQIDLLSLLLIAKLSVGKAVDLGEVLNISQEEERPLFEDVAYDSSIAFEIFMDQDESLNVGERNQDGPKAPTLHTPKPDDVLDDIDSSNNEEDFPDLHSHSRASSTYIAVFVGLIVYLANIIF